MKPEAEAAFNSHVNAAIAAVIATMPPPLQQPAAHAADAAVAVKFPEFWTSDRGIYLQFKIKVTILTVTVPYD